MRVIVPDALSRLVARTPKEDEMPLDLDWRMVDTAETSEVADMPEERRRQGELLDAFHGDGHDVLLFDDETPAPARESALAAPPR